MAADEDWLDTAEKLPVVPVEVQRPSNGELPGLPLGPQAIAAGISAQEKRAQFVEAWGSLTESQRVFLNTWRECRFNTNRAVRVLAGTAHAYSANTVYKWQAQAAFEFVRNLLRSASIEEILSKESLVARQEDIVETLLTPKPILHQGYATGHFEVEAGAAGKANEVLLKLGGHLKDEKPELNVGIVGPSFVIQVVQPDNTVLDVTPRGVPVPELPEPAPLVGEEHVSPPELAEETRAMERPAEGDWLDGA